MSRRTRPSVPTIEEEQERVNALKSIFEYEPPEPSATLGSYADDDPIAHWSMACYDIEINQCEDKSVSMEFVTGWGEMFIRKFYGEAKRLKGRHSSSYSLKGAIAAEITSRALSLGLRIRNVNERL